MKYHLSTTKDCGQILRGVVCFVVMHLCLSWPVPAAEQFVPSDNIGQGHLTVRSLSPGHLLRPSMVQTDLPNSPAGTWHLGANVTWGNIWNYKKNAYRFDGEWTRFEWRLVYALRDNLEIGCSLPCSYRTGGCLDGLIEGFHETFGYGNAHRDEFPRNQVAIDIYENGVKKELFRGSHFGLNDIPLYATWLVTPGTHQIPAIALQAGMTLPVGDEDQLEGIGTPAYELGLMLSKRLGHSSHLLGFGGTLSYADEGNISGLKFYPVMVEGIAYWEYQISPAWSLLLQYALSSPTVRDFYEYSNPIHEIYFGTKFRVCRKTWIELSIIENLFTFNNSTDFGLHAGIRHDF